MPKKGLFFDEKIDIETNNPRKLFRAITDLFDEQLSEKGYVELEKQEPKLESPMEGVAEFEGFFEGRKEYSSKNKGKIIGGVILTALGGGWLAFSFLFGFMFNFWVILIPAAVMIIAGVAMMANKSKTELFVRIDLEGESYTYKGNKGKSESNFENRERTDVVSDVRITLQGSPTKKSHFGKKDGEEFRNDLEGLYKKLHEIVPEYRIPV